MNKIMVVAEVGLRVPLADNPHQYITDTPQEVDGDNVYYRRLPLPTPPMGSLKMNLRIWAKAKQPRKANNHGRTH